VLEPYCYDVPTLTEVETLLVAAERRLERRIGEAKSLASQGQKAQEEAKQQRAKAIICEEALTFLNSFADQRQSEMQRQIEELVTLGLQTVFEEPMTFHVHSENKANRTEVRFVLRSMMGDEPVETPILDARGGGVAAVVGFMLRLIVKMLSDERPLLVLDETFAQLSAEYEGRLAEFMVELVEKTGVQIVMVTHSTVYESYADQVYRFGNVGGKTTVEDVS
jgi:ABC-type cobalamin/Fe3+-siderophores transport system ATPase subunit